MNLKVTLKAGVNHFIHVFFLFYIISAHNYPLLCPRKLMFFLFVFFQNVAHKSFLMVY